MRKLFETGGFLLALLGAAGLCRYHFGWAPFGVVLRHIPQSRDLLWISIGLIVVGLLSMVTPDFVKATRR